MHCAFPPCCHLLSLPRSTYGVLRVPILQGEERNARREPELCTRVPRTVYRVLSPFLPGTSYFPVAGASSEYALVHTVRTCIPLRVLHGPRYCEFAYKSLAFEVPCRCSYIPAASCILHPASLPRRPFLDGPSSPLLASSLTNEPLPFLPSSLPPVPLFLFPSICFILSLPSTY